jgi:hypothetical protein
MSCWFYLDPSSFGNGLFPKLFTLHCTGSGGLETYFVGKNLFYRILPNNYTLPSASSNGILIGEFKPNTWYYIGLNHEKGGALSRSQLYIVINEEAQKTIYIDLPKIAKEV